MKEERAQRREQTSALAERKTELSHLRSIINPDNGEEEKSYLAKLEREVRTAERFAAIT
jgi:hypothetical protein